MDATHRSLCLTGVAGGQSLDHCQMRGLCCAPASGSISLISRTVADIVSAAPRLARWPESEETTPAAAGD
jgi:hypothetical protein